ncbi:MAG: hypothetical protein GX754_09540, partial [Clostridiaceae bacterium]|nr:hypothetical protein [Clostridiaceae bacterium]
MVRKYQRKAINIFLLAAMLLAALTSSCSGDDKDSIKVDYAALENIRIISEGYYVFPPPVTYDMLDIEVDSSGLLYIADKDKVLRINPEKQQYEEFIIGLGYCRKILVVQDKFFILDQGNEKSILKIYNLKGSILNEIELEYNVVKMQPIDSKGETIALLIIDENQNKKITLLETESREITSLDFTNIISFCTYQKNKLCIVTRGGPYTLEIY